MVGSLALAPAGGLSAVRAGEPYLSVERLGKRFGRFAALSDVSLSVSAGEFVCFLGPSGCGKTTLLRAIAGLDPPSEGRIVQAGADITALPPSARDFGIVFQSYALFPNLTVAENVGYGLRGRAWPRPRRAERVRELLDLVGLADQGAKYPAQLSGGQQQRVALARALAPEPGLLLLDEPLSALDAIVRHGLRAELRALQRRLGITSIMVTHDQEEAMAIADRIVVMRQGRIEQVGTAEELYERPASAFVAAFIGRSSAFDAVAEGEAIRSADGHLLPCPAAFGFPRGEALRVFLRPEHLRFGPDAAGAPGAFPARVAAIEFHGGFCRIAFESRRLRLEAVSPPERLRALGLAPGAEVPVLLPPERLRLFRA
ncbi:MAG: ATP-binding cassette domain-containing protein [Acetobacteraceae bacterium]|nr:ATP-binding cassette domain-containing protein [Acetobacteraceae bacterium]MDW8397032.1 ATP-binding cassette domain-containing protein [Acetobacteraceae bacterium]